MYPFKSHLSTGVNLQHTHMNQGVFPRQGTHPRKVLHHKVHTHTPSVLWICHPSKTRGIFKSNWAKSACVGQWEEIGVPGENPCTQREDIQTTQKWPRLGHEPITFFVVKQQHWPLHRGVNHNNHFRIENQQLLFCLIEQEITHFSKCDLGSNIFRLLSTKWLHFRNHNRLEHKGQL